jgi:integrase
MLHRGTRVTPRMVNVLPAFPERLAEAPPRKGFIKDEQFSVLASHAKVPWLRAFIECAYKFGFRKGELLGLRKRQVDLIDGIIRLEDTKSGDPRQVPMTAKMRELMLELVRGKNDDDPVFTRPDGSTVVDFRDDWYNLSVAAKLGRYVPAKRANGETYQRYVGLNPHDFRRSAIRNMVRRGVGEKISMTISGHSTRAVFDRYNLVDPSDLAEATKKIEAGQAVPAPIPAYKSHTKRKHGNVRVS